MEKTRIELEAKAAISGAWNADAERMSVESKLETSNSEERISSESLVSSGTLNGIVKVHEKDAEIDGEQCHVVVTATTDRYGKTTYRDAQGRIQGTKK